MPNAMARITDLPSAALELVFGNLRVEALRNLGEASRWACQQVRQNPWYSKEAGQPMRKQKLVLSDENVEAYLRCARQKGRAFTSLSTLEYVPTVWTDLKKLLEVVHAFCTTAVATGSAELEICIKGYALHQRNRDAVVGFASNLLHLLSQYPNIKVLQLPMPADRACIARLAHLPGLRHLTLDLFHPRLVAGELSDPATDLEPEDRQGLLGIVFAATPQVTHLTLEHSPGKYLPGDVPLPPQLQHCGQLQAFHSRSLPLGVYEPEDWAYLAGASNLRDIIPRVTIMAPPPPGTCLTHVTEAFLIPDRLADLGPMMAALPALEAARVNLNDYMDPAHDSNQVFTSNTLHELDVELWGPPDVEVACCEALLAAWFPQLRQLMLGFSSLNWPRAARGDLSGFPLLSKLGIVTMVDSFAYEGHRGSDILFDLQEIIMSGRYVEELELSLDVDSPLPQRQLVGLIRGMPRLTRLKYNNDAVADDLALEKATEALGCKVELVNVDIEEELRLAAEEEEEVMEEEEEEEEDEFEDEYEDEYEEDGESEEAQS